MGKGHLMNHQEKRRVRKERRALHKLLSEGLVRQSSSPAETGS
jgi:hypothetical protein